MKDKLQRVTVARTEILKLFGGQTFYDEIDLPETFSLMAEVEEDIEIIREPGKTTIKNNTDGDVYIKHSPSQDSKEKESPGYHLCHPSCEENPNCRSPKSSKRVEKMEKLILAEIRDEDINGLVHTTGVKKLVNNLARRSNEHTEILNHLTGADEK